MQPCKSPRRSIRGILGNFIGTMTSRYADFDGYWVYGFLVAELESMTIDLLEDINEDDATPAGYVRGLARRRFREQVAKGRLTLEWMREARLVIARTSGIQWGRSHHHPGNGHEMTFKARVTTDTQVTYDWEKSLFVAIHDPRYDRRSTRRSVLYGFPLERVLKPR